MARTYTVADAVALTNKLKKGVPTTSIDNYIVDMAYGEIWRAWPWYLTRSPIAAGTLPVSDGVQDYSAPPNIYRLLTIDLVRTDTTPIQHRELNIVDKLEVDLVRRSYFAVRCAALEPELGQIRLESALNVPASPFAAEIQGTFQRHPDKITSSAQGFFFHDQYLPVLVEGIVYWYYKLADDARAGGVTYAEDGAKVFTGQYASFQAAINTMAQDEDFGELQNFFPDRSLGVGRDVGGLYIFGY